jgi:hypothetical protein
MITGLNPNDAGVKSAWPVYNSSVGGGVGQNMVFNVNGSFIEYDDFRASALQWIASHFLDVWGT